MQELNLLQITRMSDVDEQLEIKKYQKAAVEKEKTALLDKLNHDRKFQEDKMKRTKAEIKAMSSLFSDDELTQAIDPQTMKKFMQITIDLYIEMRKAQMEKAMKGKKKVIELDESEIKKIK